MTHTALPWILNHDEILATSDPADVVAICEWGYDDSAEDNAEFIVRACNAHDGLVKALKAAQQFIRNGIEFGYIHMPDADTPDTAHKTPALIEAALAKAQS